MGMATAFFVHAASQALALIVVVGILCVEGRSVHASIQAYDNDNFAQTGTTAAEQMLSRALASASHLRTEDNVKSKQGEESDELISWQSDCEVNVQPHPEASPGRPGSMGLSGPSGPTGPAGANGINGKTGPAGLPGRAGVQGPQGSQGAAGSAGAPGPSGTAGVSGANGASGSPGPAGGNGAGGAPGAHGAPGSPGASGPSGASGAPGICLLSSLLPPALRVVVSRGLVLGFYLLEVCMVQSP